MSIKGIIERRFVSKPKRIRIQWCEHIAKTALEMVMEKNKNRAGVRSDIRLEKIELPQGCRLEAGPAT